MTWLRRHSGAALLAAMLCGTASPAPAKEPPQPPSPERAAEYAADVPKSVIELQQFRRSESTPIEGPGGRSGEATLTSLNAHVGAWFVLRLDWQGGESAIYHLENPAPGRRGIRLDAGGLVVTDSEVNAVCPLWTGAPSALERAAESAVPFAPLCDGRIHLRNRVSGRRTNLERVTELLREHVPGGESIIGFVRRQFFADAFLDKAEPGTPAALAPAGEDAPGPAAMAGDHAGRAVSAPNLGIAAAGAGPGDLALGRWHPAAGLDGVHVSVMQPGAVAPEILASHRDRVNALDPVESSALVYLVAFDLGQYALGWARGTDHPGVEWSPRPAASVRKPSLPGPDGFDTVAPLVTTGMLNPALAGRAVATFAGGFKRRHGAFKYGDMAGSRKGHHYGFVEQGVVLSKLQPGLATLYALTDGTVEMKTWTDADDIMLPFVAHARQNGVPLLAPHPASGGPAPGTRVNQWGAGNWSGSAEGKLRSIRAGACLMETASRRFLVYAHFSSATPSAMARVFQAYGCRYAMLLDMNAPVHTYLAAYPRKEGRVVVEHLVTSMAEVDMTRGDEVIPRFIGFPDNRDFFYLLRREGP